MIEDAADRAVFMDADAFADVAMVRPGGGAPVGLSGIFRDPAQEAAPGDGPGVSQTAPEFTAFAAEFPPSFAPGDVLTIRGVDWRALRFEPQGDGLTRIALQKQ